MARMFTVTKTGWGHDFKIGMEEIDTNRYVVVAEFKNGTTKRTIKHYTAERADEVMKGVVAHSKAHPRFPFEDDHGEPQWKNLYRNVAVKY